MEKKIYRLVPAVRDYLWGGTRLIEKYGKTTDSPTGICAESWELSCVPGGESRLGDGTLLRDAADAAALGPRAAGMGKFPMLIKWIDARADLSVQVHPTDRYAAAHENSLGKTEMWHIVEAAPGAGIYLGLRRAVTRGELEAAIADGSLVRLLNFFPVRPGDTFFIPAGTLHAIGAGCLLCEIQQNSDVTYRVWDWGRLGRDGKPRELHVRKALDVVNTAKFEPIRFGGETPEGELLGECAYFRTTRLAVSGSAAMAADDGSFRSVTVTSGSGTVSGGGAGLSCRAGDSFFVPAGTPVRLAGTLTALICGIA